ncbi:hypothetical protein HKX48_008757 [Thoreauomyces humboldtii]|nr:hypothetical protein HKX48_008757 [Thoreauomyces humboldtii]
MLSKGAERAYADKGPVFNEAKVLAAFFHHKQMSAVNLEAARVQANVDTARIQADVEAARIQADMDMADRQIILAKVEAGNDVRLAEIQLEFARVNAESRKHRRRFLPSEATSQRQALPKSFGTRSNLSPHAPH